MSSPFAPPPARDIIEPPTAATGPSTFLLAAPIAPLPDHSGRYAIRGRDSTVSFTPHGFAISLAGGTRREPLARHVSATIVGSKDVAPLAEHERRDKVHHYVGDPSKWQRDMPTYGQLAWEEIRPGVDMVVEPSRGGFAYRFVLSPGANVSDLALRWDGATAVRVVDEGRGVDLETDVGVLRVRGLRAFAVQGERRIELAARHVAHGNEVGLEVDGWDGRTPLVIDPTIKWSSYLGGASSDYGTGIAVDASGNAFVVGWTQSSDFPTDSGFGTTFGGSMDASVTKVSGSGALLWSSYLGGADDDYGASVAVDASGNAFFSGTTRSTDFPSSGGFQTTIAGATDAFVTKVSGSGALLWSSFLGGTSGEEGQGIAVDGSGNAFAVGYTYSTDFPSIDAFQPAHAAGYRDAYVTKVSGSGALLWSSFLGGVEDDRAFAVAADGSGNAFVTGDTLGSFPTTAAFEATAAGDTDAFVIKVSGSGALLWSSYLGGIRGDTGYGIAADASGNVFVAGESYSPALAGGVGLKRASGGDHEPFVTKVSGSGALLWSTFLGGAGGDGAYAIAVDASGDAVVTGWTASSDFPRVGGFKTTLSGGLDGFVTKVSGSGATLWSSYLGGDSSDYGNGIAVDAAGNAFVTGSTDSTDFPSSGGFDTSWSDSKDSFVTKLQPATGAAGAPCMNAGECLTGYCIDGVCCDRLCAFTCEACTAAKKGSGVDGTCGPIADGTNPDHECLPQSCDAGAITKPQVCNGAGACRADGTISCGLYPCSGTACATSCASDADCVPSAFCAGTTCTPDLDLGTACSTAAQCKSGFCADGVCCGKACDGKCEACTAAKKGSGVDGTCANVAADTNPRGACTIGSGTCPADGLCDGAGGCRSFAKAGTPCGATTCSGGTVIGKVCAGDSATCADTAGVSCAPYACGAAACKTSCSADDDCTADTFCSTTGACVPKAANGAACTAGHECTSGLCADGVCCNAACAGACESCNEPGSVGSCTPVMGKPRGTRTSCDALAENDCAKRICDGKVRDMCAGYANGGLTTCGAEACTADEKYQAKGSCDGAGHCVQPAPIACIAYVCDTASPTGCKSSCAADTDCTNGNVCDLDKKVCSAPAPATAADAGCGCETGPRGRPWSFGAIPLLLLAVLRRRDRHGRVG